MRIPALALILVLPATAFAQTPRDIAAQIWPHGAPVEAPVLVNGPASAGSFTASDLTRQFWPHGAPSPHLQAPRTGSVAASGMTAGDLARAVAPAAPAQAQPVRMVSNTR
jgi:hypothetical protein